MKFLIMCGVLDIMTGLEDRYLFSRVCVCVRARARALARVLNMLEQVRTVICK